MSDKAYPSAFVRRQPLERDHQYPFPWFYIIENDPPTADAYDYGSVATFEEAIQCVCDGLAIRRSSKPNVQRTINTQGSKHESI